MGYFGIGTRENKIAWSLIAVFIMLGVAFWIPGVLQYKRCLNRYQQCVCKGNRAALDCLDPLKESDRRQLWECRAAHEQCRRTPIIIWGLGWLFLVGFSWLPCFYFCCCAKDPAFAGQPGMMYQQQPNGVQMATGQPYNNYGPAAHYTTHPFTAQPYGPMPYYNSSQQQPQQQQGSYPASAYPVGQPPVGYPVGSMHQQQQQQPPSQQQQPLQQQQPPQQQQAGRGQVPVSSY